MLPSFEDVAEHPYWYARVLGIYHTHVFFHSEKKARKVEFLWVRWFGKDADWNAGPDSLRHDRVGYVPSSDADAFGFLDPKLVLRACHLIPSFHWGKTLRLLGPSIVRDSNEGDWTNYYVNRYEFKCNLSFNLRTI